VTPAHAILNYCFALLEAETRLALSALGLDPSLHTDTADRSSLAFDVLEPVRPQVETWLLDWVAREPFRRADFFETATGNCRLMSPMCTKLGGTVSVWGKLVAPWAEYVARTLWAGTKSGRNGNSVPPTRLTQQRRTEAKGKMWISSVDHPKTDHICRGCGKTITNESTHCANCAVDKATERLISVASLGRKAARSPEARAKHGATRRGHAKACSEWDASTQPAWLTSKVFSKQIQPLLGSIRTSAIRSRIGVSRWYAGRIRQGYLPHPRHWQALAELVRISE
jgi:CRISPR associated protein Cas1